MVLSVQYMEMNLLRPVMMSLISFEKKDHKMSYFMEFRFAVLTGAITIKEPKNYIDQR